MSRKKRTPFKLAPTDEAIIHSLSHEGRGVGKSVSSDKTVFIDGALPGERVIFRYRKQRTHFSEGYIVPNTEGLSHLSSSESPTQNTLSALSTLSIITNPSPLRVEPQCPHFGNCGGCAIQHIQHDEQIKFKQSVMLEQLKHFGNVQPEHILPPILGLQHQYRRKARLSVRYVQKKEALLIGFSEKYSHKVAEIESCAILHPSVGEKISELKEVIANLKMVRAIPQIEVAVGDMVSALVIRHLEPLPPEDLAVLKAFGELHQLHFYGQPKGPDSLYPIWPVSEVNDYRLSYRFPAYDLTMRFHPLDFTQIHQEINQQMVATAIQLLDPKPTDRILDLYCGLGNFTLPLARFAKAVVGIEGSKEMVERAKENAQYNQISNAEFYEADLNLIADPKQKSTLTQAIPTWQQSSYDKILIDPARSGAEAMLPFIANCGAKRIVYVSCNPATFARDIGILVNEHGFRLVSAGIMDMFPHTAHVESIALLEK